MIVYLSPRSNEVDPIRWTIKAGFLVVDKRAVGLTLNDVISPAISDISNKVHSVEGSVPTAKRHVDLNFHFACTPNSTGQQSIVRF